MEVADEVVGPAPTKTTTSLVLSPHPLTLAGRTITAAELLPGETLACYLLRHEVDLDPGDWMVCVGGAAVPRALWARTRPHHGQVVECRRMAGKDVLRFAAFVVLTYYTFGAGTFFAGTSIWAAAANAALFVAGAYVINRVLPPSSAKLRSYESKTGGSTYSLSGGRNRARPYEPLGLLFGTTKVVPDYAALPYTWFESETQMLSTRFSAGVNAASVASLKIGATAIESYADVVVQKVGFPSGNTAMIDWANVDTVAGGTLDAPTAPGAWVTRTSSPGSTELALDITAQLYSMADSGAMNTASVTLDVEMRLLPSGSFATVGSLFLTSKSTAPLRLTRTYTLTPPGQYEVRLRKATVNVAATRAANVVEWAALKSYQAETTDFADYAQVGLRMRATGQLNGVLDELNWVATSNAVPVWSGSAWVTQATRNPGAHMLAFMRGISDSAGRLQAGMGLPDAQIDIDSLKGFMLHCAAQGFVFDDYLDEPTGCLEYLDAMAAVGLGSVSRHTGKLGVVWLASGQPIEAVVNMATMKPGSFRVEYATRALAEELEVSWFERTADYAPKSLRLLAPGVTVPRETARLAPRGVTTEAGAVRMARLAMAQNLYGRKLVSWDTDLEHLAYRRYSLVALSHDLTQWGYGGRLHAAVDAAGTVTLMLDEEVPAGATRYIGLRIPGEAGYRVFGVAAFTGTTRTVVLTGAWPSGVPLPGDSAANPAHDTIWIYDFKAEPGLRLRVTAVEPNPDMKGARVTAVPEPDEFWTFMASGAYTVAATPASAAPASATGLQVSQRRLDLNATNDVELTITWTAGGAFDSAQVWGAPVGQPLVLLGDTRLPRFGPVLVGPDGNYQIEVRPFDQLGRPGVVLSGTYSLVLGTVLVGANYTWIAYANNSTGTAGFTTGVWSGQTYLGLAVNKTTATKSTNPADYTWSRMEGAPGAEGQGQFTMALSAGASFSGGVLLKTSGGTDWNQHGYSLESYRDAAYLSFAARGIGNLSYAMGALNSDPTADSSWTSLDFAWYLHPDGDGYVYESGGTPAGPFTYVADDVFSILADGETIRYFQNGTLRYTSATSPANRVFHFDSSLYVEGGGLKNIRFGPVGRKGQAGAAGVNTATIYIYQRAASAPALPSVAATYTFATAALTGLNNGWYTSIPAGSNPLYVSAATAASTGPTDTIATSEWAAAVPLAQNGADGTDGIDGNDGSNGSNGSNGIDGLNSATVYLFQRTGSDSEPGLPSATVTYTFSTGAASGVNNGWTQTLPTSGGAYRWVTTAAALSSGATDTIASGEWAAVSLLAQDGSNGSNGIDGTDGSDGAPGAPGAAAVSISADRVAVVLAADSTGVIDAGLLPTTVTASSRSGTTDDTASWSWTRSATTGITTTLAGAAVTITAMTIDSGEVTIIGTRSGYSTISVTVPVTKAKRATPNAGPVPGVTLYAETYMTGPTDAYATVYFQTDGRIFVSDGFGYNQQGNWYVPTTTGIGSDFDVRMDITASDGNSGGFASNAEGSRARLDVTRYAELVSTEDSSAFRSRQVSYSVFRRSDGAQQPSGAIFLVAGVDV